MTTGRAAGGDLTPGALLGDGRLLVILFVAFRLILLMIYQPLMVEGVERGLGVGGDTAYYHALAALTDEGFFPYRDWWYEFPPVAAYLHLTIYALAGGDDHTNFTTLFGIVMLLFDVGNLLLLRKLGARLYGANTGMALAWIYTLLLAPAVFLWWNFEPMVAFWLLLALWWLARGRETASALAAAVGTLTKFTPALLLGAVWRFRPPRVALRYTVLVVGSFLAVYVLLFAQNAAMTLPSLTAQFSKPSYQSVWALIDGNYTTGNFGDVRSHLDPAQAAVTTGNPAVIPAIVRLVVAGGIGVFVFLRARRLDDRGLVAFVTITLLIFFLQAQGWSPQWLGQIIPLLLLCFPTRNGVLVIVLLSALVFAEYPVLFMRTGDTGGVISGSQVAPFVVLVLSRTALLVGVCVALYGKLRQEPLPRDA